MNWESSQRSYCNGTAPKLAETDPWIEVSTSHFMTREEWTKYSTFDFFKVTMFAGMAGEISYEMLSMHISLSVLSWAALHFSERAPEVLKVIRETCKRQIFPGEC